MASHFDSSECEWGQYEMLFNGAKIAKVTGMRYGVEKDDEELYAAGDDPLDIQYGNRKYSGELTMLKGAIDGLNQIAVAAGYRDFLDVPAKEITIVQVYRKKGNRMLVTDTCLGCSLGKYEMGWSQGAKSMPVTVPFKFLKLKSVTTP